MFFKAAFKAAFKAFPRVLGDAANDALSEIYNENLDKRIAELEAEEHEDFWRKEALIELDEGDEPEPDEEP